MIDEVTMDILGDDVCIWVIHDEVFMLERGLKRLLYHVKSRDTKRVVGLSIMCSIDSQRYPGERNTPVLLQLCSDCFCVIIQLNYFKSTPSCLARFLECNYITFVGVGMSKKLEKLEKVYDLECSNYFELGPLAAEVNRRPHLSACGLLELFSEVYSQNLEIEMPEGVISCDYSREVKGEQQIRHAAFDAHAPFLIGQKLLSVEIS